MSYIGGWMNLGRIEEKPKKSETLNYETLDLEIEE
jgi:hypothetical protein